MTPPSHPDLSIGEPDAEQLWDLEVLARARGLGDWQYEQFAALVAGRVLEVGAGIGTFTERLLAGGAEQVVVIEPEAQCLQRLDERFARDPRVEVSGDELPESPTLLTHAGSADLVVCQNVLEHIADDREALRAMARSLAPGGRLFLLVPAHPWLYGTLDRTYGHHRRYTHARLRELSRKADLRILDLYSFNLLGVPGWVIQGRTGRRTISPRSLRLYEALLRAWKPIERQVRPPGGLSLILIAERR